MLEHFLLKKETVVGSLFGKINTCLDSVLAEKGTLSISDERFGKVQWPFEEYIYLCTIYELDKFYEEIKEFLVKFDIPQEIFENLLIFQKNIMKKPFAEDFSFEVKYNLAEYFNNLLDGKEAALIKKNQKVSVKTRNFDSWELFAKIVAWYGRKDSNSTYIKTVLIGME